MTILALAAPAWPQGYQPDDPAALAQVPQLTRYRGFLPPRVDLAPDMPPPGDQGEQSSCVAFSLGYALRSYYAHKRNQTPFDSPQSVFSPAFIYNRLTRTPRTCDAGLSMIDALKLLRDEGIATAAVFPYERRSCVRQASDAVLDGARQNRIAGFRVVRPGADEVKGQLALGNPVAAGLLIDFPVMSHLRAGQIYDVDSSASHDGHAVAVVGYDDARQAFKFLNSWGAGWADHGFGWISYGAFERDAHVAVVMSDGGAELSPPRSTPVAPDPAPQPTPTPTPAPTAGDWHEQLVALAQTFECAEIGLRRDGGTVVVFGWVGKQSDLDALNTLLDRAGGQARFVAHVALRPWPQCEAMLTLADVVKDHGFKMSARGHDGADYAAGDTLQLSITTPDYPSYLYVTYVDAGGNAVPLYQPRGPVPQALPAGSTVTLGGGDDRRVFRIGPPFGPETVVAVAARSPLFTDGVPPRATERAYLTALRKTLSYKPDPSQPDRVVDGDVIALTTHAAAGTVQ